MAEVAAREVKALRDRTGAGMMECKAALQESGGDVDKAIEMLRVRGQARAATLLPRSPLRSNAASVSGVPRGLSSPSKSANTTVARAWRGSSVRASCTTTAGVRWVSEDEVPDDERDSELRVLADQAAQEGGDKPEEVRRRIAEGRLGKWLDEVVLLRQAHVNADRHDGKTIEELRAELAAKTGENVVIRRFARFAVGEA